MTTFLDGPHSERFNDELGTMEQVGPERVIVDDAGTMLGQIARVHIMSHGTKWMARDAWHAKWGDIPGQAMGWTGRFDTAAIAESELREAVHAR